MRRSFPLVVLLLAGVAACGRAPSPQDPASDEPRTRMEGGSTAPAASEAAADAQGRLAAGPSISPTAAPGVAFNYRYSFALAAARVAELQERHAAMCEELTAARCRITGMHYRVLGPDDIEARLELKLDPGAARGFGRRGVDAVLQADGMLTENEISGVDVGSRIDQAGRDIARLRAELTRIERSLARRDLPEDERARLEEEARTLREQIQGAGDQREEQRETLATTPMVFNYGSGRLVPGYQPPQSLGEALGRAGEDFVAGARVLLVALIRAAPFLLLLALLGFLALWARRRWLAGAKPERAVETPAEA